MHCGSEQCWIFHFISFIYLFFIRNFDDKILHEYYISLVCRKFKIWFLLPVTPRFFKISLIMTVPLFLLSVDMYWQYVQYCNKYKVFREQPQYYLSHTFRNLRFVIKFTMRNSVLFAELRLTKFNSIFHIHVIKPNGSFITFLFSFSEQTVLCLLSYQIFIHYVSNYLLFLKAQHLIQYIIRAVLKSHFDEVKLIAKYFT